jgi:hypothetical protein
MGGGSERLYISWLKRSWLCLWVVGLLMECTSVSQWDHRGTVHAPRFFSDWLWSPAHWLSTLSGHGLHAIYMPQQFQGLSEQFQDSPLSTPVFSSRLLGPSTEDPHPNLPDQSLSPSFHSQIFRIVLTIASVDGTGYWSTSYLLCVLFQSDSIRGIGL